MCTQRQTWKQGHKVACLRDRAPGGLELETKFHHKVRVRCKTEQRKTNWKFAWWPSYRMTSSDPYVLAFVCSVPFHIKYKKPYMTNRI